jgi:lysyl-tRNA synthetase class 1
MPAIDAKSWPFEQAKLLVKKFGLEYGSPYPDKHVLFQTGFGATGTGHAGTFSEITRTNMVRVAFEHLAQEITGNKNPPSTILVTFADDYDALRRVPEGCPKSMEQDLGLPVTSVRDPSGEYRSFGERNVEALRKFSTDYMNISPAILSATELYTSGRFNVGMIDVCKNYDAIMDIMLPTLGGQGGNRRDTYSPIMPISTVSGRVLQVPVSIIDADNGIIEFLDEDGSVIRTSALNGAAKLQWKVDWAMRWHQLGVDYEMYGKDLIDSFVVSKKIVKLFGSEPPVGMSYELFVDENGKKISKSVGNGVSVEEWMQYGTPDALSMFMF